jgi:hypothetical protein
VVCQQRIVERDHLPRGAGFVFLRRGLIALRRIFNVVMGMGINIPSFAK